MNKAIQKIIENEDELILKNILIELIQMDKQNEERVLQLYNKY